MQEKIDQVRETISTFICEELSVDIDDIEHDMNLGAYGLGSAAAAMLTGILEDTYEVSLSPVLIFDFPTIDTLSAAISEQITADS